MSECVENVVMKIYMFVSDSVKSDASKEKLKKIIDSSYITNSDSGSHTFRAAVDFADFGLTLLSVLDL